ncbi:MAG: hypothetical protein ACTS6J_24170 [Burkholderiales bacterium]
MFMSMSPAPRSAVRRFCLMSARSVKRWARGLVFVWFGMWLSAALLHCNEVVAAAYELAQSADCGNPTDQASDTGGYKTAACLVVDEPAAASAAILAAPIGGNLGLSALPVSSSFHLVALLPELALPPVYRVALPLVAVYLRNSRLLI